MTRKALQFEGDDQGTLLAEEGKLRSETLGEQPERRVVGHGEQALLSVRFDRNRPFAKSGHPPCQAVHAVSLGAAMREAAGLRQEVGRAPLASFVKLPQNWHLRDSGGFNIDSDEEVDMDADSSITVDEDEVKVGPRPFGGLSNTTLDPRTLDPRLGYQAPPYGQNVKVEQSDILLNNGLEVMEDSAMVDVGTVSQEVEMEATATQPIQSLQWDPLVMPGIEYPSHSNIQPCAGLQTASFGDTPVHPLQPTVLNAPHTREKMACEYTSFLQVVPVQEIAPLFVTDGAQSSTSMLEVETSEGPWIAVPGGSPISELVAAASYTHTVGHSGRFSSPPTGVSSAPAVPLTHSTVLEHQRGVGGLTGAVDPQSTVAGSQREVLPLGYVLISLVM